MDETIEVKIEPDFLLQQFEDTSELSEFEETMEVKMEVDEVPNMSPLPLQHDGGNTTDTSSEFKIFKSPKKEVDEIPHEFEILSDSESNGVEIKEEIEEKYTPDPVSLCNPVLLSPKKKTEKLLKCSECTLKFLKKTDLHKHIKSVHTKAKKHKNIVKPVKTDPDAKLQCPQCDLTFTTAFRLQSHEYSAHPLKKEFKCSLCDLKFSSENIQQLHEKFTHPNFKESHEEQINPELKSPNSPNRSIPVGLFPCPVCPQNFRSKKALTGHKNRTHPIKTEDFDGITETKDKSLNFDCPECTEKFRTEGDAILHWRTHGSAYSCPLCPSTFKGKGGLTKHRFNVHKETLPNSELLIGKLKCSKCDQQFNTIFTLSRHEKHHGDKYPCQLCPGVFELKRHIFIHQRDTHPGRDHCKYNYQVIQKSGDKKCFRCLSCAEEFPTPMEAIEHEKSHVESWSCEFCDAVFKTLHSMKSHIGNAHPEYRKYNCSKCALTFPNHNTWRKHTTQHRRLEAKSLSKIKCSTCDLRFVTLLEKTRHEKRCPRIDPKKKDYIHCHLCPKVFKTKGWFIDHKKRIHEEEYRNELKQKQPDFEQEITSGGVDLSGLSEDDETSESISNSVNIKAEDFFVIRDEDVKEEFESETEDPILGI